MSNLILSSNVLPGPWQVVIVGEPDPNFWYIHNTITKRFRKVGKVGTKRTNYYDKAFHVAWKLNQEYALKINAIFDEAEASVGAVTAANAVAGERGWLANLTPGDFIEIWEEEAEIHQDNYDRLHYPRFLDYAVAMRKGAKALRKLGHKPQRMTPDLTDLIRNEEESNA